MGVSARMLGFAKGLYKKYQNRVGRRVIHVESPHYNPEALVKYCQKYRPKCFCITPVNYDFLNVEYSAGMSYEKLGRFLKDLYPQMKEAGAELQLHVHVSQLPALLPIERKRALIENAFKFFKNELGIVPTEIIFGWFSWDKEMEDICKELGLRVVSWSPYIYDRWCEGLL
jgi:hypothetical protein